MQDVEVTKQLMPMTKSSTRDVEAEAVKFLWKRKHFEEAGSELGSIWLFEEEPEAEAFSYNMGRDVKAEARSG